VATFRAALRNFLDGKPVHHVLLRGLHHAVLSQTTAKIIMRGLRLDYRSA
jgi:hypothetical protein